MRMWWNGRHDSFRSYWRKLRGGSSPLIRTTTRLFILAFFAFIIFAPISLALAENHASFKVDGRVDGNLIRLTVQNPPAGTDKIILKRAQSGFDLKLCSGGTAPLVAEQGFIVKSGIQYCDSGVVEKTSYDYTAYAKPGNEATNKVVVGYKTGPSGSSTSSKTLLPQDLNGAIKFLIEWSVYRIGPGLVAMIIIFAGFQYISSQGNETVIKEAKDRIIKALIGLILLMLIGVIMRAVFL